MTTRGPLLNTFHEYLHVRRQPTLAEAARAFRACVAPFGFVTFAAGELDLGGRDRSVYYVIDWPDSWRKFYLNSHLIERDPVIDSLARRREPFTWSDLRSDRQFGKAGREALKLLAEHGWRQGLVVPIPGAHRRVGLVSLVGTQPECDPETVAHLSFISVGFLLHAKTLATRQGFARPPAGLTAREIECVKWVALGEPDAVVARRLGVARSTAHEFIEKAKRRLKTRTRAEMIAVAVTLGLVDL